MQWIKWNNCLRVAVFSVALVGFAPFGAGLAADTEDIATVSVEDVSARVGEKAIIVAKITPREGYKIAEAYRNRLTTLSAADDGVEFADKVVRGSMLDGSLVFKIRVTPKTLGAHAINGVLRLGFVSNLDGDYHLDIKSVPLIATVTGTE